MIHKLPSEILDMILYYTDWKTNLVCKLFHDILQMSSKKNDSQ